MMNYISAKVADSEVTEMINKWHHKVIQKTASTDKHKDLLGEALKITNKRVG